MQKPARQSLSRLCFLPWKISYHVRTNTELAECSFFSHAKRRQNHLQVELSTGHFIEQVRVIKNFANPLLNLKLISSKIYSIPIKFLTHNRNYSPTWIHRRQKRIKVLLKRRKEEKIRSIPLIFTHPLTKLKRGMEKGNLTKLLRWGLAGGGGGFWWQQRQQQLLADSFDSWFSFALFSCRSSSLFPPLFFQFFFRLLSGSLSLFLLCFLFPFSKPPPFFRSAEDLLSFFSFIQPN